MAITTGVSLEHVRTLVSDDIINLTISSDGTVNRVRRSGNVAGVGVFKGPPGDEGLSGDPGDPGDRGNPGATGVSSPQVAAATNTQVLAGTSNSVAITAKNLASYLVVRAGTKFLNVDDPPATRLVTFPSGSFSDAPKVLVTAQSTTPGHNVTAVTVTNVTATSFDLAASTAWSNGTWTISWIAIGVFNA